MMRPHGVEGGRGVTEAPWPGRDQGALVCGAAEGRGLGFRAMVRKSVIFSAKIFRSYPKVVTRIRVPTVNHFVNNCRDFNFKIRANVHVTQTYFNFIFCNVINRCHFTRFSG